MIITMKDIERLKEYFVDIWSSIAPFVNNCAVYIDYATTEWLHWHTGGKAYSFLKDAKASSVHNLTESTYTLPAIEAKDCEGAVIISTSVDATFYKHAFKMIMEKNVFNCCTIITAAHPNVMIYQNEVLVQNRLNYKHLEMECKMSLKQKDCILGIMFQPIFISPIDNGLFVTPPFADLMPPLNEASNYASYKINHFVNLFYNFFTHLNLKEDIYSIGKFSEYVAEKLYLLPEAIERRNNLGAKGKGVSLIFIDRTLDFCAPTSNNTESLLARILCTLPHLSNHSNDVAINMSPLFCSPQEASQFVKVPGCLASVDKSLLNILITKNQKEVLAAANKMLVDILEENLKLKENPKPKLTMRISAHSLEKLVNKFKDINEFYAISESRSEQFQVVLAVIQALMSEKTSQLELLISLEKLVLQNIAVSRESTSVLGQFSNIIRTRDKRGLNTDNILALLVHIYALAGTEIQFSSQQEQQLQEAIADAILEDIAKCKKDTINSKKYQQILCTFDGKSDDDEQTVKSSCETMAKHIMSILHEVAQKRASLHNYTSLMSKSSSQEIVRRVGTLQQLLRDVLHPDRPELLDLHQISSSTGFNLFSMGRKKRHPCDNDWIIVYVIGGVTPDEVREVKEIASSFKTNCKITIAGSKLLKPMDIVDTVLQKVN